MFKIQIDPKSREFQIGSRFSLTGFALQVIAEIAAISGQGGGFDSPVGLAAAATGTLFFVIGVFYLARSKNRSPGWAVLGLFSLFGWILVAFLEDRAEREDATPAPSQDGAKDVAGAGRP